jgi:hypothetical protein
MKSQPIRGIRNWTSREFDRFFGVYFLSVLPFFFFSFYMMVISAPT